MADSGKCSKSSHRRARCILQDPVHSWRNFSLRWQGYKEPGIVWAASPLDGVEHLQRHLAIGDVQRLVGRHEQTRAKRGESLEPKDYNDFLLSVSAPLPLFLSPAAGVEWVRERREVRFGQVWQAMRAWSFALHLRRAALLFGNMHQVQFDNRSIRFKQKFGVFAVLPQHSWHLDTKKGARISFQ